MCIGFLFTFIYHFNNTTYKNIIIQYNKAVNNVLIFCVRKTFQLPLFSCQSIYPHPLMQWMFSNLISGMFYYLLSITKHILLSRPEETSKQLANENNKFKIKSNETNINKQQ